ncbi:GNAT family N-acetyltransferase [Chlorogloeopsis sp. ULAP01]|uniref:GNAT family N-acetyltransferase n=1 Tax=Chlorogloeopsis sp. ULAP01 TaxID=3056483 RepID=UPI0025AAB9B9|nr:GNAT family N-acetyltransferase [Chlorogloeopsis sp. ULAP01]MDM9384233.1 GNAT family N-acetyltransferase [Chlorogloeopsis sp. ULAP01]
MTLEFEYSILANSEDVKRFGKILEQCFIGTPEDENIYINKIGVENFRVLHRQGQVVGGLAHLPMAQWWGNQKVPMTGIAAVGVAPEYRGTGAAITLMRQTVQELYAKDVPISVLFPATQRLYRKAGYEQGGAFCSWEITAKSIQSTEQPLPVVAVPFELELFNDIYQQQAKLNNGNLDRYKAIWQRIIEPDEKEATYIYAIASADAPQGYIIFSQHSAENDTILRVKDWVILTADAARTFWSFMSNHRSQIDKVRWRGSTIDALTLLLPEQTAKIRSTNYWMLRVLNVVKALEKRGYSPGVEAELHLEIQDDLLAQNNGKYILSVANGRGEVTSGGKGELQIDIRRLAPLYTGLFTPVQLQLAGKLDATETALFAATQIFTGASPWMPDFF